MSEWVPQVKDDVYVRIGHASMQRWRRGIVLRIETEETETVPVEAPGGVLGMMATGLPAAVTFIVGLPNERVVNASREDLRSVDVVTRLGEVVDDNANAIPMPPMPSSLMFFAAATDPIERVEEQACRTCDGCLGKKPRDDCVQAAREDPDGAYTDDASWFCRPCWAKVCAPRPFRVGLRVRVERPGTRPHYGVIERVHGLFYDVRYDATGFRSRVHEGYLSLNAVDALGALGSESDE